MSFLGKIGSKIAQGTIGGVLDGVGDFAKDVRAALTGEMTQEQKSALAQRAQDIEEQQLEARRELNQIHGEVVKAEAQGDSWLQRNWRPLLMLWFAGLVGAHWLGYTPENLSQGSINMLLGIVKLGIGGYIIGRTGEKIAPGALKAFTEKVLDKRK